ncbi:MAG: hypothetical protein GX545_04485 [Fibrobacter sp.]|jgi:hypothetical protein|nr:hypothetical protein [Fibrobacter sp.]
MEQYMLLKKWILSTLLFLMLNAGSALAAFDVNVKASVSASQVFIGDIFDYSIEIVAPKEAKVNLPSFIGNLQHFEVKEMKNFREDDKQGQQKVLSKFIWEATLNTFVSGDFFLAPQSVEVIVGKDTVLTKTDPVAIKVMNRTTGEETDILEAEGPITDPRMPTWVWVFLIILGVLLLIVLGWFLHKKWSKKEKAVLLPPYEEAVLAFKELQERHLLEQEEQAEYFTVLGLIIRRYIQRRFDVEILDATLTELRQRMAHVKGLPQAYKESVVLFSEETETVKFAKMKIEKDRCLFWNEWTDRLFEETRPQPEEKKDGVEAKK